MATLTMMLHPVRDTFPTYPQHYTMHQSRVHPSSVDVSYSIDANSYPSQAPQAPHQPYPYEQRLTPRSPPATKSSVSSNSDVKPLLPSISNLLGIADRPRLDTVPRYVPVQSQQLPGYQQHRPLSPRSLPPSVERHSRLQIPYAPQQLSSSPRSTGAPPPYLRNDSVLEGTQSPTFSTKSSASGPPYFVDSPVNQAERTDQRISISQLTRPRSISLQQPALASQEIARYTTSPSTTSPGSISTASYYSPTESSRSVPTTTTTSAGLFQQRALPSNFPPTTPTLVPTAPAAPAPVAAAMPHPSTNHASKHNNNNPWEHHHYIGPTSQSTFPHAQDRYICPTCNKAFSRPSSLKIHSHSHTGEKPFRCPHAGCGKAFSVRSNMKRHERGCHSGMAGAAAAAAAAHHLPPPPPPSSASVAQLHAHAQPPPGL